MPTAARETFKDDVPLFSGTHDGADAAASLRDVGARFRELGVDPSLGQYVANTTQGTNGAVTAATSDTVTVSGVTWDKGDSYEIYATATKNSFIAGQWTDVSRGWKINIGDKINAEGWREEDWDLDGRNRAKVFGPGQPE